MQFGIPVNADGKRDWYKFKEKVNEKLQPLEKDLGVSNFERLMQQFRMQSQYLIEAEKFKRGKLQEKLNEIEECKSRIEQ